MSALIGEIRLPVDAGAADSYPVPNTFPCSGAPGEPTAFSKNTLNGVAK